MTLATQCSFVRKDLKRTVAENKNMNCHVEEDMRYPATLPECGEAEEERQACVVY